MFIRKIFVVFLIITSLLLSGCGKDKNSNYQNNNSDVSVTSFNTDSKTSQLNVSSSSTSSKSKNTTDKSKLKNQIKTNSSALSTITKPSQKPIKTSIQKTKSTQKSKAEKTRIGTTIQRENSKNIQTTTKSLNNVSSTKSIEAEANKEFYVLIEIECKSAVGNKDLSGSITLPSNGIILSKTEIKVKSGQSALDVTKKVCQEMNIPIVCLNKSYVQSIGPIGEKQCGKFSGWTYKINGNKPSKSSDKYILEENDTLVWSFTATY